MESVEVRLNQGGLVAGRDIIFGDSTEFFEPRLDDVRPPDYLTVKRAFDLVEQVARQRLLILGGHRFLDRETFALHLAWLLKTRLETSGEEGIDVRQWSRDVDRGRLLASFQRHERSTVFLLPEARPAQFGFDVRQLRDDLTRTDHFAILSSASDREHWGIDRRAAHDCWFDAPTSEVFPAEELTDFLFTRLESAGFAPSEASGIRSLCDIELHHVVSRLKTPGRIVRFVRSLDSAPKPLETALVERELEQFADGKEAIQRWYRRLDRRRQLLTLGLVLFDGLYEDQVFAALEEIMKSVWNAMDPRLGHFDCHDLEVLRAHFPNAGLERQISTRSEAVRQEILEVAWTLHRRHIMAVLPVKITLLKQAIGTADSTDLRAQVDSAGGKEKNVGPGKGENGDRPPEPSAREVRAEKRASKKEGKADQNRPEESSEAAPKAAGSERLAWDLEGPSLELWGSETRSAMLRDSIGDALGRLSQLAADGLDSQLRALAGDPAPAVQIVAAEALAGWRQSGDRPQSEAALFEKLGEWNARTFSQDDRGWRPDLSDREERRRLAAIRATVAMTVGYAARYDLPDRMCSELTFLFESFLEEKHEIVRKAFSEITMPMAMGLHLLQLEPLLYESARRRTWLRRGLALGFVLALELRPDEALATMDSWHARAQSPEPQLDPAAHERSRENVLAALIEAYSLFSSFSKFELFGIEVVFSKFQRILAEEKGRYLRRLTLWGALVQFRRRPSQAEALLQNLVSEATLEERTDLIQGLGFIFWDQRQALEGGDTSVIYRFTAGLRWWADEAQPLAWDEIAVRGSREFSIWFRTLRSWTPLEQMLRRWLQDEDHPVAQQFALEALVDLHAKEEWLMNLARKRRTAHDEWISHPPQIHRLERSYRLSMIGRLLTYLSTSETSGLRNQVLALLPQLLHLYRRLGRRSPTTSLLTFWKKDSDLYLARLASRLELTARLYRWRYSLLGLLAAALASYYWLLNA